MKVSRGFACSLAGLAITILAWYGPWLWPAWPALAIVDVVFTPKRSFAALPFDVRAGIIVALITVNVAAWGGIANAFIALAKRITKDATRSANG